MMRNYTTAIRQAKEKWGSVFFGDVQSLHLNLPEQLYMQKGVGSLDCGQHCLINSHVLLSKDGSGLHFRKLQWLWDPQRKV